MKFFATLALVAGANALVASPVPRSSLIERDLATAKKVLGDVQTGFDNLQKAAAAFNGDPTELKNTAATVIATVEKGTNDIKNMAAITSVSECLQLVKPADDLAAQGDALAKELESRIADVQKVKECSTVRGFLSTGVTDAQALIDALKGKVPTAVQGILKSKGDKIVQTLKDAQAAFAEDKCSDN